MTAIRVKTVAAQAAFEQIIAQQVEAVAGGNTLISRVEQRQASPFIQRAITNVRALGAGTRPDVGGVTLEALALANGIWAAFGTYLAERELVQLRATDPDLALWVRAARDQVRANASDPRPALKQFFSTFDFSFDQNGTNPLHHGFANGQLIDVRPQFFPQNRVGIPANVLGSFDYYARAEAVAGTNLQRVTLAGVDLFVVHTRTDGDDRYLEIFSAAGEPLLSGRLNADTFLGWDETFGRVRFNPRMTFYDNPVQEEGFSDPADIASHGQVPRNWAAPLTLDQGRLHYDAPSGRLTTLDLPQASGSPLHEVAAAAFEYLWAESLRYRVQGTSDPFELGATREGVLKVGTFKRNDGKTYEVADWRDIDDGSYTLYFDRAQDNRLRLATVQFNN